MNGLDKAPTDEKHPRLLLCGDLSADVVKVAISRLHCNWSATALTDWPTL